MVAEPADRLQHPLAVGIAALLPGVPLQVILEDGLREVPLQRLAIAGVVGRRAEDPRNLDASPQREGMALEPDADASVRDRLPAGVHHGHREVSLADAVDPFPGCRPPGRVGFEAGVATDRAGQRAGVDGRAVVVESEVRDLHRLRREAKPQCRLGLPRRHVLVGAKRHGNVGPRAGERMRAFHQFAMIAARLLHHGVDLRLAGLVAAGDQPGGVPQLDRVARADRPRRPRRQGDVPGIGRLPVRCHPAGMPVAGVTSDGFEVAGVCGGAGDRAGWGGGQQRDRGTHGHVAQHDQWQDDRSGNPHDGGHAEKSNPAGRSPMPHIHATAAAAVRRQRPCGAPPATSRRASLPRSR